MEPPLRLPTLFLPARPGLGTAPAAPDRRPCFRICCTIDSALHSMSLKCCMGALRCALPLTTAAPHAVRARLPCVRRAVRLLPSHSYRVHRLYCSSRPCAPVAVSSAARPPSTSPLACSYRRRSCSCPPHSLPARRWREAVRCMGARGVDERCATRQDSRGLESTV